MDTLKENKSPNDNDGITNEWLKCTLMDETEASPVSPMAKVVFELVSKMWSEGAIPTTWQSAVVVPILKKGDPLDCGNYRGISLINAVVKVVAKIIADRLAAGLSEAKSLAKEQGGFRIGEESVAQATALYEAVLRRKRQGKRTYVCFVDFKKAYDTVPHKALMQKLSMMGVRGKAWQFIKGLYSSSRMQVRTQLDLTGDFDLRRGLRQGCPLSPILFNVFINDLVAEFDGQMGVSVPRLVDRLILLLFADDVCMLARSARQLQAQLDRLTAWADRWGMEVGHDKCGVMRVCAGDTDPDRNMRRTAARGPFVLQRRPIEVVKSYRYLGIPLEANWSLEVLAQEKADELSKAFAMYQHFLTASGIQPSIRLDVFKTFVLSRVMYGGELLGMNKSLAAPCDRVLVRCLKTIFRLPFFSRKATIYREFGVAPIYVQWSAQRARALRKWVNSPCWVGDLIRCPVKGCWIKLGQTWLKSTLTRMDSLSLSAVSEWDTLEPKVFATKVKSLLWDKQELAATGKPEELFAGAKLHNTIQYLKMACEVPEVSATEVRFLTALRVNGFWTAAKLAQFKLIPDRYSKECPFCGGQVPECRLHMVVQCSRLSNIRSIFLQPLWALVGAVTAEEKLEVTLGGGLISKLGEQELKDKWVRPCLQFLSASRRVRYSTLDGLFVAPPRRLSPPTGTTPLGASVPT